MTKKKVKTAKQFEVMRGIGRDDLYRFEAGAIIAESDLPDDAPLWHWVNVGVLKEVKNGNGKD